MIDTYAAHSTQSVVEWLNAWTDIRLTQAEGTGKGQLHCDEFEYGEVSTCR